MPNLSIMGSSFLQTFKKTSTKHDIFDRPLAIMLGTLALYGLIVLYSASNRSWHVVAHQGAHFMLALVVMFICSRIPPNKYQQWAPYVFAIGCALLLAVMLIGHADKGARRWLILGPLRLQPSELMKLLTPLMLASFLAMKQRVPQFSDLLIALAIMGVPVLLTLKQPDLGTAILIAASGCWVILLAGLRLRIILSALAALMISIPVLWHFLHHYQKQRILTFLDPARDPLGSGYHIIQSKIAIGSGGIFGKGWLHGTQSHLQFLPEHTTDFIFAVLSEELGLIGCLLLIGLVVAIFARCIWLARTKESSFPRLVISAIAASFLLEAIVNMGMVTGVLPVVGVPLPFFSYGGSALITLGAGFGIIMAMQAHKTLW